MRQLSGVQDVVIVSVELIIKTSSEIYKAYQKNKERKANNKKALQEIYENCKESARILDKDIDNIEKDLEALKEMDRKNKNKIIEDQIKELMVTSEDLTSIENYREDIDNMIKELVNTKDNLIRTDKLIDYKMQIEDWIEIEEKKEEEMKDIMEKFDIKDERDFEDETKASLILMYENLKGLGYNPVVDIENNKIIVMKESGDQIIAEKEEDKLTIKYNDYEGKDCIRDMHKIEQHLRKKGIISPNQNIYVKWYDKEDKEKNKNVYLKNKKIYQEAKKNYKSMNQKS